jgi:hypothetical protein
MKRIVGCGKAQRIAGGVVSLLWLLTVCSISPPAAGQDPNGLNSTQSAPSIDNDLRRFSPSPVQLGPAAGPSWTSLGSYNFQNQTLSPDWRPPANNDLAPTQAPAATDQNTSLAPQESPIFNADQNIVGSGGSGSPTANPQQPAGEGISKIILANGLVISVPPGTLTSNQPAVDGTSLPAHPSKGWLSYICVGERGAGDTAKVAATLKGLGVESEALDTLTEAVSSHSVLAIAVVGASYEFYRYNCP